MTASAIPGRMLPGVSAVLPVLNEEGVLPGTCRRLRAALREYGGEYEIIFVDDGSDDGTALELEELARSPDVRALSNSRGRGLGGAVRTGWEAARFDKLLYLDADMPVGAAAIAEMLSAGGEFPVVIGVRDVRGPSGWRRALSASYNAFVAFMFGLPGRDVHFGAKLLSRKAFSYLPLTACTAFFNVQLLVWARYLGLQVRELPLHHTFREKGYSKGVRFFQALKLVKEMLGFLARLRLFGKENCWVLEHYDAAPLRFRLLALGRLLTCPWKEIVAALPPSGRVVDAGCGLGLLELLGKKASPELEFFAFDPDPRKLAWASAACARLPGVDFSSGPAASVSLPRSAAVCQVDSLYLMKQEERIRFFSKVLASLKDNGVFILKECVSGYGWKTRLVRIQEWIAIGLLRFTRGAAMILRTPSEMKEELSAAGFEASFTDLSAGRPHPHALYLCRRKSS